MNPRDFRAEVRVLLHELDVTVEPKGAGFSVFVRGRLKLHIARLQDLVAPDLM